MKTQFIINPRSGAARRALPVVEAFAKKQRAGISLTTHPRHATELARSALNAGFELVVAVGGDGTLNEVAAALVDSAATFGLIPCGSGDGLGRHLGIHGSVEHALDVLLTGRARPIDSGVADGHPFFTLAGLGFEAELADRFNRLSRRGFVHYLRLAAQTWRAFQPLECSIECGDGRSHKVRAFTLAVGNSDQYGNNARIAPGARVDDGLLDLTVVPPLSLFSAIPLAASLFSGGLASRRDIVRLQSARFVVDRRSPGLIHTDGETHQAGARVEFQVRPASLRVLTPAEPARAP